MCADPWKVGNDHSFLLPSQEILSNSSNDIRLLRKAVSVVADLAEYQLENIIRAESPCFRNRFFLKSVVDLTASTDLDLQEKVVLYNLFCCCIFTWSFNVFDRQCLVLTRGCDHCRPLLQSRICCNLKQPMLWF
jgi:hypothetical protein